MLRIPPIGYAPWRPPCWAAPIGSWRHAESHAARPPAPWQGAEPPWRFEPRENRNAMLDLDYFWTDRPPLENLSSALTYQNALLQRNVLLQTGMNSEHVGILVRFQPYSAKGASLPAVMPAVWATPEFAERVERQHERLKARSVGAAADRLDLSA